jgi:hypothetical protein
VLSYGAVYNRITTQERAIYFETAEDIILALRKLPELDLEQIAHDLKWIADMRYLWSIISKKYAMAFKGIEREAGVPVLESTKQFMPMKSAA